MSSVFLKAVGVTPKYFFTAFACSFTCVSNSFSDLSEARL